MIVLFLNGSRLRAEAGQRSALHFALSRKQPRRVKSIQKISDQINEENPADL